MNDTKISFFAKKGLFLQKWSGLIPGLAVAAAVAAVAQELGKLTVLINDVIIAILIGAVMRNLVGIREIFKPGLSFSLKKVLRLGGH